MARLNSPALTVLLPPPRAAVDGMRRACFCSGSEQDEAKKICRLTNLEPGASLPLSLLKHGLPCWSAYSS